MDLKLLKGYDFVEIETEIFGLINCIILEIRDNRVRFIPTDPYEKSADRSFRFMPVILKSEKILSFKRKKAEDMFMLWGKSHEPIVKAQERLMYALGEEGK